MSRSFFADVSDDSHEATSFACMQDVTVTAGGHSVTEDPSSSAPPSFEWRSTAHGFLKVGEGSTQVHLTIGGVSLEANLTNQVPLQSPTHGG